MQGRLFSVWASVVREKRYLVLQLAAEKKTPILVQLKRIFGLSDYDRALVRCLKLRHTIVRLSYGRNLNGLGFKL